MVSDPAVRRLALGRRERIALDGTIERQSVDSEIQVSIACRQFPLRPTVEPSDELFQQRAIDGTDLDGFGFMDTLSRKLLDEAYGILVRVDDNPRRCFACFVQTLCVRGADLDPNAQGARLIA